MWPVAIVLDSVDQEWCFLENWGAISVDILIHEMSYMFLEMFVLVFEINLFYQSFSKYWMSFCHVLGCRECLFIVFFPLSSPFSGFSSSFLPFLCLFLYFVSYLAMFPGSAGIALVKTKLNLINNSVSVLGMTSLSYILVILDSWQPMWRQKLTRVILSICLPTYLPTHLSKFYKYV